jgi:hypothetical protein
MLYTVVTKTLSRLVFGYKAFFGSTSFLYREIKSQSNAKKMALELEPLGLSYEKGQIKNLNKHFEYSVGFCKVLWKEVSWVAGAGHFESTESGISGNGAFLSLSKRFGETLSLY